MEGNACIWLKMTQVKRQGCEFCGNLIFLEIVEKFPEISAKAWKL